LPEQHAAHEVAADQGLGGGAVGAALDAAAHREGQRALRPRRRGPARGRWLPRASADSAIRGRKPRASALREGLLGGRLGGAELAGAGEGVDLGEALSRAASTSRALAGSSGSGVSRSAW
jgi:hypothetical protein